MKYQYVETFLSIEGEAKYAGWPTVYVRFTKCNFTCKKFNNPDDLDPSDPAVLKFDPKDIKKLTDIPEISVGCDSIYAFDRQFEHLWVTATVDELAQTLTDLAPHGAWKNPKTGQSHILSLTGGEPTLQWKKIPTLLNHPLFDDLELVLIETNCSVPFKMDFIDELNCWLDKNPNRKIIWSNSPKMPVSGEPWKKTIKPIVPHNQRQLRPNQFEQYFKFVCGANQEDFDMVEKAMDEYHINGLPHDVPVYIMPMSCTEDQQLDIAATVADTCLQRGYIYCHRVHNSVYQNAIGK